MEMKGGIPKASGTYGCVFSPALKCSHKKEIAKKSVSKLMFTKYAQMEYDEIIKFIKILKSIKNYQDFFLIDNIEYCSPDKIKESDLKNFNTICSNFVEKKITSKNINENIHKLKILTMKDGGMDLDKYFKNKNITKNEMLKINRGIINLIHVIMEMNKKGLYHFDIKAGNILIDKNFKLRLVDWGLAGLVKNLKVPYIIKNRPLQYNCPYTSILLNSVFETDYNNYLKLNIKDHKSLLKFVINYYEKWKQKRGFGHEEYVIHFLNLLFHNETPSFIKKYHICGEIECTKKAYIYYFIESNLIKYTKNNKFQKKEFLETFFFNADIWGVLMSFEPILNYYKNLNFNNSNKLVSMVKQLLINTCFSEPANKINIKKLIDNLKNIDYFLRDNKTRKKENKIHRFKHKKHIKSKNKTLKKKIYNNLSN